MGAVPEIFKAALWMSGWLVCMSVMAVAGREATREIAVFQIMELRSLIGLAMLSPLILANGGLAGMRTPFIWRHVSRNIVHYGAQGAWLFALTLIPLAQVIAIEFTMPIWVALLAVVFLGERMGLWKNLAVALGLLGVLVIVRPLGGEISAGQLIALASAFGFATSVVLVKSMTGRDKVVAILFWMMVLQSLIGLVPALGVWKAPSAYCWGWILVIAFCGTYSHYCMTRALLHAEATIVVPMDFLRVPIAAALGWLVYSEGVDGFTALGAAMILAGNLFNLKSARKS